MWHTPPQGKVELGRPTGPTLRYILLAKGCLLSSGQVATYVIPESARAEFWPIHERVPEKNRGLELIA